MEATKERRGGYPPNGIENRVRLTIEVEAAFRQEVKAAAAKRGMSMREYITDILSRGHAEALEETEK